MVQISYACKHPFVSRSLALALVHSHSRSPIHSLTPSTHTHTHIKIHIPGARVVQRLFAASLIMPKRAWVVCATAMINFFFSFAHSSHTRCRTPPVPSHTSSHLLLVPLSSLSPTVVVFFASGEVKIDQSTEYRCKNY